MLPLPVARMSEWKKTRPTSTPNGIEPARNAAAIKSAALTIVLFAARARPEIEGQRNALEVELTPQRVLEEALVRRFDQIGIVAVEDEARRMRRDLRRVIDAQRLAARGRRRMRVEGVADQGVERCGRDAPVEIVGDA